MNKYKAVKIEKGPQGWGGPLIIKPTEKKNKIASVTGGGIHPLAQYIADLTGGEAVDAFSTGVPDEEMAVVIVDCGGTARCGVYPRKGVYTINLNAVGAVGPLAQYIKEEIYVSDVKEKNVTLMEGEIPEGVEFKKEEKIDSEPSNNNPEPNQKGMVGVIARIGKAVGGVVNKFFAAGRDAIDTTIRNILPFMAFVSMLLGICKYASRYNNSIRNRRYNSKGNKSSCGISSRNDITICYLRHSFFITCTWTRSSYCSSSRCIGRC